MPEITPIELCDLLNKLAFIQAGHANHSKIKSMAVQSEYRTIKFGKPWIFFRAYFIPEGIEEPAYQDDNCLSQFPQNRTEK